MTKGLFPRGHDRRHRGDHQQALHRFLFRPGGKRRILVIIDLFLFAASLLLTGTLITPMQCGSSPHPGSGRVLLQPVAEHHDRGSGWGRGRVGGWNYDRDGAIATTVLQR
jgi:hypothetical protein